MTEEEGERLGLVPTHAYAVLDVRDVNGLRFLQVKNPWSRNRWRGNYSHLDQVNWTPALLKALGYDREAALRNDDGIFWISWDSVIKHFDTVHLSWNPELLKCTFLSLSHSLFSETL